FVAVTAQTGRLYEIVHCRAVGRIRNQAQQKRGGRIDTICRDLVAGKWGACASASRGTRRIYSQRIVNGRKARCGKTAHAFRESRNGSSEHGSLAQAETFPAEKGEKLVSNRSTAYGCSILILGERCARDPSLIGEKLVGVQNFVAEELVGRTVPFVGSRLGAQVNDATGEFAPVRTQVVVLDLKFGNRILCRKDERQINIADIKRLAVEILCALVRKGAANLKISEVEWVLADGRAIGVSLRDHGGSDGREVKN